MCWARQTLGRCLGDQCPKICFWGVDKTWNSPLQKITANYSFCRCVLNLRVSWFSPILEMTPESHGWGNHNPAQLLNHGPPVTVGSLSQPWTYHALVMSFTRWCPPLKNVDHLMILRHVHHATKTRGSLAETSFQYRSLKIGHPKVCPLYHHHFRKIAAFWIAHHVFPMFSFLIGTARRQRKILTSWKSWGFKNGIGTNQQQFRTEPSKKIGF